jgi:hypothetical protein
MTPAKLRSIVAVFGLSLELLVHGLGAEEDRILDRRHAALLGLGSTWLKSLGWQTRAEVSYSHYGERGSVDLLAWHDATATLLVVEVKSELASIESTLRKLDEKTRLGPTIARQQGWIPSSIGRLLMLPDDRTQRRRVAAYGSILVDAYPCRNRSVRAWCREPAGSMAGLIFLSGPISQRNANQRGDRRRIRLPRKPSDTVPSARTDANQPAS